MTHVSVIADFGLLSPTAGPRSSSTDGVYGDSASPAASVSLKPDEEAPIESGDHRVGTTGWRHPLHRDPPASLLTR